MRRRFIDQVRSAVACVVQCEERLGNRHGHGCKEPAARLEHPNLRRNGPEMGGYEV